ncbi:Ig domain-containing protein [Qiania dongpingensis]|uniref:Putative Ig domain-containing protein n=1 Tax=Qiania dongpingensis TaxID=2763669 RepID=A0A7G9G2V8_9FIRM|nr:Ig domain-containing protein [Qiania dongpingensis]QNM05140.1 putative Ig domain-containing protein [Qiania dongpingensis]
MRMKRKSRLLSLGLCLCMLPVTFPLSGMTYAAETSCPNHQEHTQECGYVEAQEGAPCTHTCELCDGSTDSTPAAESTPVPEATLEAEASPAPESTAVVALGSNSVMNGLSPVAVVPGGNVYNGDTLASALGGNDNATVNGNTVTLNKDVNLNGYVLFYNAPVILDLNGYTLGADDSLNPGGYGGMLSVYGVTLTIQNGTIRSDTSAFPSIRVYGGGCINLENVQIEGDVIVDEDSTFQANTTLVVKGGLLSSGTVRIANGATLDLTNGFLSASDRRKLVIFKADNNEAWDTEHPLVLADVHTSDWFFKLDPDESGLPEGYHLAYALNGGTSEWKLQPPGYAVSYSLASHLHADSTQGTVKQGDDLTIMLTAEQGYQIIRGNVHVFAVENGGDEPKRTKREFDYDEATGVLTVENVTTDLYIQVLEKIIVTSAILENGRIEIEDTVEHLTHDADFLAAYQEKIIIRCYPDPGYQLSSLTVNGKTFESGSVYTVMGPTAVTAVIEPAQVPLEIPPKITTTTLKSGLETAEYQELLGASGSTPITWSVVKGRFPDGLTLTSTGHIQGTPVLPGIFKFTLRAENSVGSDERKFTIEIRALPDGCSTYSYETLTDPATGIKVSGLFSSDAALAVRKNEVLHEKGACPACDDIRARQERGELLVLYDIGISTGSYQGELEVTIPVGEAMNGQTVYFLHCSEKVLESRTLTVENGVVTDTFSSLSPYAVAKTESKTVITGLPDACTLNVGQSISWMPAPVGGAWSYDKDYLEMTQGGGTYTFKALKVGKATATYTVDGVSYTVTITINKVREAPGPSPAPENPTPKPGTSQSENRTPQTGDTSNTLPFVLLALASLLGCIGLISCKKLGRKNGRNK